MTWVVSALCEVTGEYNRACTGLIPQHHIRIAPIALFFLLVFALESATGLFVGRAGAQKPQLFAQYEEQLIKATLAERGLTVEPDPEGKLIEAIFIANHEIFLPGDLPLSRKLPWMFLNRLHTRTRDYIVRQEILIDEGSRYQRDLVEETERNLRGMFILAVARLVAVRGSSPDRVAILVVTKDRWTLRLNTSFLFDNGRLDQLAFSMSESNLAGRNKRVSFEFSLNPGRYAIGTSYYDPRIWSSRHTMYLFGLIFFNRESNDVEGGQVQLNVGRPLFNLRSRFGWQANLNFLQDIARYFKGGDLALRTVAGDSGDEEVPDVYTRRNIIANLQVSYSDGLRYKSNLTFGVRYVDNQYGLPNNFPAVSGGAREAYLRLLPRSESWAGAVIAYEMFTPNFIKLKNINTFALTEDFRLGPRLQVEIKLASHVFGPPSDFIEFYATFNHFHFFGGNLLDYGGAVAARVQYRTAAAAGYVMPLVNESATVYLREVTPRFGPLRLFIYGILQVRAHDLDNVRLTLGSDSGLRGFAPRELQGNSLYRINVELRTTAINLWTIHIGGVLFYDAGDAPLGFNQYDPSGKFLAAGFHQSAGLGLRVLFPQFNRDVIRLDLGFPFEMPTGTYAPRFSVEFGQAF
jgi:hypothetical protein